MSDCNCDQIPTAYTVTIGPVDDNGTPGYLKQIEGKWWFMCSQGTPMREVSDEEIAAMQIKW